MANWSFIVTNKSQVNAQNVQEIAFEILKDGVSVLQNCTLAAQLTSLVDLVCEKVKTFAVEYEAAEQIVINEEIRVI